MNGYRHYARIMEKYGPDAQIYKTSGGTGDVYVAGLYFKDYLKAIGSQRRPVFTVIHRSGYAVAELFQIENIELIPYADRRSMVHLGIFVGFSNIHFAVIHHNPNSLYTSISAKMEAVHDMCSLDVLKSSIYDGIRPTGVPIFDDNEHIILEIFQKNNLCIGKTVVLTPYSVSMKPLPKKFWEKLVEELLKHGYSVCTNSKGGEEPPIKGTNAIHIPIKHLVPFLNRAGTLIGVRSGIIDVTVTANIKRVIFYSDIRGVPRGQGGHNQKFYPHFSFNKWFRGSNAFEISEYASEHNSDYIKKILEYLHD